MSPRIPARASALALLLLGLSRTSAAQDAEPAAALSAAPTAGGLRADDVAARAISTSVGLERNAAETRAARQGIARAELAYYPRLTLTARYTRLSDYDQPQFGPFVAAPGVTGPVPPGTQLVSVGGAFEAIVDNYLLQAQLVVPISDYVLRASDRVTSAELSTEAARLQRGAIEAQTRAEAKSLYYAWVQSKLSESVARQSLEQNRKQAEIVQSSFDLGKGSKADVLAATARVASAEKLVSRAEHGTAALEAELRALMHDTSNTPYAVGEDVTQPLPSVPSRPLDVLLDEAWSKRSEIRALEASERALESQRKLAKSAALPRLDAFANAYLANPNQRYQPPSSDFRATWDAGLQLTWVPNDWLDSRVETDRIEAERARLSAQRSELRDALRRELIEAQHAMADAESGLESSRRRVEAAVEAHRARTELFSLGRATAVEVLAAETEVVSARFEEIATQVSLRVARVQMDHALGR